MLVPPTQPDTTPYLCQYSVNIGAKRTLGKQRASSITVVAAAAAVAAAVVVVVVVGLGLGLGLGL
eukprot:8820582-Alexandrium_andersonii.AAC.1